MVKRLLPKIKRIAVTSLALIATLAVLSVAIGSLFAGQFTLKYIFTSNFVASVILMFGGIVVDILPVKLPKSKLIDHTTHSNYYVEQRMKKREKAYELIYLGMCVLLFTSIIQLVLSFII